MSRTASETSAILSEIYDEQFANDSFEQFRISWPELRSIAGVVKLTTDYLNEVDAGLRRFGHLLVSCNSFILVASEQDLSNARTVPARLVESYLYDEKEAHALQEDED